MLGDEKKIFILDGDVIRTGLNKDLGFSAEDRAENIRRISEVAKLFAMSGQICFVAFISPYAKDRDFARKIHNAAGVPFHECHIAASLEVCEQRDVKGLYKKARAGVIKNFTGISDPYEAPANPEMRIDTGSFTLDQCIAQVIDFMESSKLLKGGKLERIQHLFKDMTIEDKEEIDALEVLDISLEQAGKLKTIADGWASPLDTFMNERELAECIQFKSVTSKNGEQSLLSIPLTQPVNKLDK